MNLALNTSAPFTDYGDKVGHFTSYGTDEGMPITETSHGDQFETTYRTKHLDSGRGAMTCTDYNSKMENILSDILDTDILEDFVPISPESISSFTTNNNYTQTHRIYDPTGHFSS